MNSLKITALCLIACLSLAPGIARAETLKVGPGHKFTRPSQAFSAAKDGDTIEIAAGTYAGDVAVIRTNRLTIRGMGADRVKIPAAGKNAGGKAIWVTAGRDIVIENIEFSGARVADRNGAGIRAEGQNLTLGNCRFYDCEDGILGGAGEILIEHCRFEHCGPVARPATHSLYIGERCTKLIFRYNYSTDVIQGHLLKSRARENWLLYNRLTDENGTGSAVADFPNGGVVVMVGNVLQKGKRAQNTRVIAYGMEGIKHERNALYVVNNTMVYENHRGGAFFVNVQKVDEDFEPVIRNNLCVGKISLTNAAHVRASGNVLAQTTAEAGFVDAEKYDYHLKADSPAIGKADEPGKVGDFDLRPVFQYVHPAEKEARPQAGALDAGAFEYARPSPARPLSQAERAAAEPAKVPGNDPAGTIAAYQARLKGMPKFDQPLMFNTTQADAVLWYVQVCPASSPFNEDISKRPVAPNSDVMIAALTDRKTWHGTRT